MSFAGSGGRPAEVIVIGTGVIGLACATELAERDVKVTLFGRPLPGEASRAAAGLLAPSVEPLPGAAGAFALRARDLYPEWVTMLAERTGIPVAFNRNGILELGPAERFTRGEAWLTPGQVRELEPALGPSGGVLHAADGCVDNVALARALDAFVRSDPRIRMVPGLVKAVEREEGRCTVRDQAGARHEASVVVLAAGAWSAPLLGGEGSLPVTPVRGQMLAYEASPLTRAVYVPGAYLVPRGDETLAGSTMERVAYDIRTTSAARDLLHAAASRACPGLAVHAPSRQWSGLRPMSPDGLPIIGPDPECPSLIHATGHSRNGILLARATALAVTDLVLGAPVPASLQPFSPRRFALQ